MGEILNRIRTDLNIDPRTMEMRLRSTRVLEGGHTSLQFGRSDDFVDLREYLPGDDVRDIDWRASARNTHLVVRRYVAEKAQEFLLVTDTGANMLAPTPSGMRKRDVAIYALGAVGMIACAQGDKLSLVYGDDRGTSIEIGKKGEDHLEQMLTMVSQADIRIGNASNIARQLQFIASTLDRRYAIYIVCDEPAVTPELVEAALAVRSRSAISWLILEDLDVLGQPNTPDEVLDVGTGAALLTPTVLGRRVLHAYQQAETARRLQWEAFMAQLASPAVRISSVHDIGTALGSLSQQGLTHA
jgi:uncharacterized protein (DUF58 family)